MKHSKTIVSTLLAVLLVAGCTQEPIKQAVRQIEDPPPPPPIDGQFLSHMAEDFIVNVGDRVFFDYDSATLRTDAQATIERQAEYLKFHPSPSFMIEGHADERGTREYNLGLGCRRAVVLRQALIVRGIAPERLGTIS